MAIRIICEEADYEKTKEILAREGLGLLTYQEALKALITDEKLKAELKGKWFWLDGKGTDKEGLFAIDRDGGLVVVGSKTSIERKVRVWSGKNPLSLDVLSVVDAAVRGGRFVLYAGYEPGNAAPVVVGKTLSKRVFRGDIVSIWTFSVACR